MFKPKSENMSENFALLKNDFFSFYRTALNEFNFKRNCLDQDFHFHMEPLIICITAYYSMHLITFWQHPTNFEENQRSFNFLTDFQTEKCYKKIFYYSMHHFSIDAPVFILLLSSEGLDDSIITLLIGIILVNLSVCQFILLIFFFTL